MGVLGLLATLDIVRKRAQSDAKNYGYHITPDIELLQDLLEGLLKNEKRYGYPSCLCRLAIGNIELDRDIICPCDYRDIDVIEFGCCYCSLYVRKDVSEGKTPFGPIPERRPLAKQNRAYTGNANTPAKPTEKPKTPPTLAKVSLETKRKLWYCKQCGYLCLREDPPYVCPICKAKREMFTEITTNPHTQK